MESAREIAAENAEAQADAAAEFAPSGEADAKSEAKPSIAEQAEELVSQFKSQIVPTVSKMSQAHHDWREQTTKQFEKIDLTPDLAQNIGSGRWFRGLGTMLGLGAIALAFWPNFAPLEAKPAMEIDAASRDEFRSQMIMPLALGADNGRQMGAGPQVIPLESAPERPQIELVATLRRGDSFTNMLERAGVGTADAARIGELVAAEIPFEDIESGTKIDVVLGRRPEPGAPRPLDELSFRARFDLELNILRDDDNLSLTRNIIRVDDTPLRIRGTVGSSLYRSARAAGAPASAVQAFIKAMDGHMDMNRSIRANDEFDMILSYRRAATGERKAGQLLFAGIERNGEPKTQLMRWGKDDIFYEASGVGEERNGLVAPVPGRITSRFGMRRHPILGYRRMHSGLDFRARHGTPIAAVTSGRVTSAGRAGGCGIAVRVRHEGNLSTRYCHMSRLAVRSGQNVRKGQVIGYVGSTGLSTGAHLHYEMYRGGKAINPASVRFVSRAQLSGRELLDFRATLAQIKDVEPGAALEDLVKRPSEELEPKREIERLDLRREVG